MIKNNEPPTSAIANADETAKMEVSTYNKLTANQTSKCLEIPHLP